MPDIRIIQRKCRDIGNRSKLLSFSFVKNGLGTIKLKRERILKLKTATSKPKDLLLPNPKARFEDQFREVMRFHHYSMCTEKAYWQRIRLCLAFRVR